MEKEARYKEVLSQLQATASYRFFRDECSDTHIDLSSNDYLGLNSNEVLYNSFLENINFKRTRFTASSSRLLSGNFPEHNALEAYLSSVFEKRACLLFNSGYHANVGILPALAGKRDLILADKLVHASIIDGALLSSATLMRYKHLDYEHLEQMLSKYRADYEQVFIVTESIFSMDGDVADLQSLVKIKDKYNCFLYVDEAHAIGAVGARGLGCVEAQSVLSQVELIVGTFGKALASVGAYLICSETIRQYLINHSRTLIFTTALPPVNLAWTKHVFEQINEMNVLRDNLKTLSNDFAAMIGVKAQSHIISYVLGENSAAVNASKQLVENGFNVLPIRYPTVPKGTARLRFSMRANINLNSLEPIKSILLER